MHVPKNIPKNNKHPVIKIIFLISLLTTGLFVILLIYMTNRHEPAGQLPVMFVAWLFLCLLCSLSIHKTLSSFRSEKTFQKGTISVTELDDMDGIAFEELACDILVANGFELAETTPASCDYGVDILARKEGMSYAIQCKRYLEPVGLEAVQQVYAGRAYYECHVAVVLTNQSFTANARELADKIGVVLWDREDLRNML